MSWVIVSRETGESKLETFNPAFVAAINTAKYYAVPIEQWLQAFNASLRIQESIDAALAIYRDGGVWHASILGDRNTGHFREVYR